MNFKIIKISSVFSLLLGLNVLLFSPALVFSQGQGNAAQVPGQGNASQGNGNSQGTPASCDPSGNQLCPIIKDASLVDLLFRVFKLFLGSQAVVAVIFISYGGFLMITSAGSEERITSGKKTVTWAILGLVLVFLAFGIVAIVENILGVTS